MSTLQLYITKSGQQPVRLADINPADDGMRAIADMRAAVAAIDYPSSAKLVFYVVVNVKDGYSVHVLRTIPPTRPNHLDATIFIDKNLDVMAEDLEEVIAEVSRIVEAKAVTEGDMAVLRSLFAREYDRRDKAPRIRPSKGSDFACVQFGSQSGRSLGDVIAEGLYRPDWSDYRGVILLPDTVAPFEGAVVDLNPEDVADDNHDDDDLQPSSTSQPAHETERSSDFTYVFSLPVSTPDGRSSLDFELECTRAMTASPVAGYEVSGRIKEGDDVTNRLRRSRERQTLYARYERWVWGMAGLVAGILVMWIISLFGGSKSATVTDETTDTEVVVMTPAPAGNKQPSAAKPQPVAAKTEAVAKTETPSSASVKSQPNEGTAYLDSHKIWKRDEMEKIEPLRGLFDDLDNFRFDLLRGKWAEQLGASVNFNKLLKAVKNSESKNVDPRRNADHNPRYNREGDNAITWLVYSYWIDP